MHNLCIIPARGGSKRIPRKNIRPFLGRPIIAYSIEAALKSGCFAEVMVSTDDEEIAEKASEYGAQIPFMRSAATSNDYATTADVIFEVLDKYMESGNQFDTVTCIYSTAPFVTQARIKEGFAMLSSEVDSVFTCVEFSYPVQRGLRIIDGKISMVHPEYLNSRTQDLEKMYHDAGQFYIAKVDAFRAAKSFWGKNTAGIILSELEVQDLDTLTDWEIAEMKYKLIHDKDK